jgi:hypothetical protein
MKAFILTREETESSACDDDALAYVNGDEVIQIERDGEVMKLCGPREARLLAIRLCEAAERLDEYSQRDRAINASIDPPTRG